MAPKAKPFRPVVLGRSLTLSGGFVPGKSFVPQSRHVEFICGGGGTAGDIREKKECVLVSVKEPWLCEIATGQAVYNRPLSRVGILRQLKEILLDNSLQPDAQMAALAFDDCGSEDMDSPLRTPKKKKEKKTSAPKSLGAEISLLVQVPESWATQSTKISVYASLDSRRRIWLHVDALAWLIQYIRDEKESGGVAAVEDTRQESEEEETSRIYWNFRDGNWIARARAVDGSWLQASRGIKRRQKADALGFEAAKEAVYHELEEWVEAVRAGEVTRDSDSKGASLECAGSACIRGCGDD